MLRYQFTCLHCGAKTPWQMDRGGCRGDLLRHSLERHHLSVAEEGTDFRVESRRQCDSCLEDYLDHCTKCNRDFCRFHAGDIDGLCGGCI